MSIFYPRIQEEETIRKNIALGPSGLGQYFSVLSPPLGFGGRIWIHYFHFRETAEEQDWAREEKVLNADPAMVKHLFLGEDGDSIFD